MHVLLKVLDFAPSDGLVIGLQLYFGENLSIASLLSLTDKEFDCVVKCMHDDAHGFSTDASPTTSANFNFEDARTIPPGDFLPIQILQHFNEYRTLKNQTIEPEE